MCRISFFVFLLCAGLVAQAQTTAPTTQSSTKPAALPAHFAGPAEGFSPDVKTGAINKVRLEGVKNDAAWYHLAVPKEYTPKTAYPLMIVLHGGPAGNGPDDIVSFFRGGLLRHGVISVYPNALEAKLLAWNYPESGAYMLAIIKQVARTYRIDARRIYVVGVSMGGGGAWSLGAVMPEVWAGVGPISGWYKPTPAPPVDGLRKMPIYCLHGEKDEAVTVERSRLAVKELTKAGIKVLELKEPEKYTQIGDEQFVYREVPDAPHNVLVPWSRGGKELGIMLPWLLAHKRDQPADLDAAAKSLAEWGKAKFEWKYESLLGTYDK